MPIPREYLVSFNPAEKQGWGGYTISFDMTTSNPVHRVKASSLPDLERDVRELARQYGRTCSPYVRLPRGERKPAGFDAWSKTVNIIDFVPPVPSLPDGAVQITPNLIAEPMFPDAIGA